MASNRSAETASLANPSTVANEDSGLGQPVWIAIFCLAIICALVLGVGLASHLVLRHVVQTAPLWVGVALGFRRWGATAWVALPLFLFWLALMALIWSYLLGISHIVSGHFSPTEIAMTVVVGVASILGILASVMRKSSFPIISRVGLFVGLAGLQWVCFRLSLVAGIAHR